MKTFRVKDVVIIGTKATSKKINNDNIKVFEKDGVRYTGSLVYDPHFEEYQLREVRKNKKAYVLKDDCE